MKLNKKGFMLAEVVIVAAAIAVILVSIYISINRVSNAYEKRNRYYDLDAVYTAIEVNDYLVRENLITTLNNDGNLQTVLDQENFLDLDENLISLLATSKYVNVYYVDYSQERFEPFKDSNKNNKAFSEYLEYLSDQLDFDQNYEYMLIVELKNKDDVDDTYYYTLKVGDDSET